MLGRAGLGTQPAKAQAKADQEQAPRKGGRFPGIRVAAAAAGVAGVGVGEKELELEEEEAEEAEEYE